MHQEQDDVEQDPVEQDPVEQVQVERDQVYVTPLGDSDGGPEREQVAAFWTRYLRSRGPGEIHDHADTVPPAWCFGDTVEMADELIELVVHGPKRATAGALAEYEAAGDAVPVVGELSIVTDGSLRPRALIETTDIRVGPLSSVDAQFAWDEGEGDRTTAWWLEAHTWYFTRAFARLGQTFHPDIEVVFERFALRYHQD